MSDIEIDSSVGIAPDWGMEISESDIPSKGEQEKAARGLPELFGDSLMPHPKTIEAAATVQNSAQVSSVSASSKGWSTKDVLVSAATEEQPESSSWWQWAVDGLKYWAGISSAEEEKMLAQIDRAEEVASTWLEHLDPHTMVSGVAEMATSLWHTITFAEQAFVDPTVNTVEIPKTNIDGTTNPFGGRIINRDDYKDLCRFRDDCQELLDRFNTIQNDAELEAFVMALTKALATDKEEDFDYQRTKLSQSYKERELDIKLRDKASKELIASIESNKWYGWFFDAATRTSFAMGGATLGVMTGGWGWAVPVIVLSGLGVVNSYLGYSIEKGIATVTAIPSTLVLGGDYEKNIARHTDRWKTAHTLFMWAMSASVLSWQAAATGAKSISEVVFKAVMSLSGVTQNLGQIAKTYHYRKGLTGQAEFEYRQDRLKEHEKSITSGTKGLAKTFTGYTKTWKAGHHVLQQAARTIQGLFR